MCRSRAHRSNSWIDITVTLDFLSHPLFTAEIANLRHKSAESSPLGLVNHVLCHASHLIGKVCREKEIWCSEDLRSVSATPVFRPSSLQSHRNAPVRNFVSGDRHSALEISRSVFQKWKQDSFACVDGSDTQGRTTASYEMLIAKPFLDVMTHR